MTPPLSIGDDVQVIGLASCGDANFTGTRAKIERVCGDMYAIDKARYWYPASSLRLVPSFAKGEKVKVSLKGHLYNGYEFEIERVRDGCVEDSQGRRFRFGILLKTEEELKIGDWAQVMGPCQRGHSDEMGKFVVINHVFMEHYANGLHWYPASSLRKLTPEEIAQHTGTIGYKTQEIRDEVENAVDAIRNLLAPDVYERLSAIEKRLTDTRFELVVPIKERLAAIEKRQEQIDDIEEDLDTIFKRLSQVESYQKGEMPEVIDREQIDIPVGACFSVEKKPNGGVSVTYSDGGIELAKKVLDSAREA